MGTPLFLFDIDGTLVRKSGPHHRQALIDAARSVTGLETSTEQIPLQGMLDRDILAWMLRDAGASKTLIQRSMGAMVAKAQSLYVRRCPDLRTKVCPGVRPFLAKVSRKGIRAGLVTGNLSRIGWKKVEKAGLREHFSFGAFAEQGKDRAALVRLALRAARREGWLRSTDNAVLFGDHENDILAARANGICSVAVATGVSTPEQLARLSPDFLLDDLRAFHWDRITSA